MSEGPCFIYAASTKGTGMEAKTYQLPAGMTVDQVAHGIEGFLRNKKNMVVEGTPVPEGYFIQAKTESDGWKKISGMDQATQVQLMPTGSMVNVQIGHGKWSDKVGAGVVGAVLFAPLAVTAGIGAYQATKLPKEIFDFIERFLATGGQTFEVGMSAPAPAGKATCPKCGAQNPEGTKFCGSCGSPMGNTCPSCGALVPAGMKFCPECGTSLASSGSCPKCGAHVEPGQRFCGSCGASL